VEVEEKHTMILSSLSLLPPRRTLVLCSLLDAIPPTTQRPVSTNQLLYTLHTVL
jgi:hypothetical protein